MPLANTTQLISDIKEIMETVVSKKDTKNIPLLVSTSIGPNWGELKKA